MTRWLAAIAVGLVLAGCSDGGDDRPPAPASVAELDPCDLLSTQEQADLHLKVSDRAEQGARRSCSFVTTNLLEDPSGKRISGLELVLRDSAAPNRVADAERLAETYRRERDAEVTTSTVEGRTVFQVGPASLPIGCRLLFQVNATSSLEAAPRGSGQGCELPDLTRLLSTTLPTPDPAAPRTDHDRPVDVLALDPCALISQDRLTALRLGAGAFSAEVARSCRYRTDATADGELSYVGVTIWTSGAAPGPDDGERPTHLVNERTAYETREDSSGSCDYRFEVTAATSVEISSRVPGPNGLESACRTTAELAADIEPKLPLIVT